MMDRPATRLAVSLVNEDNGGHLLGYYGAGPSCETVVDLMMAYADDKRDVAALARIEAYLSTLTKAEMESLCFGPSEEYPANLPEEVNAYLNDAFEAPVPVGAPT